MSRIRRPQPAVRNQRRPRDSRTIPLWDETEQNNGTYYICWWCGFTCNDKRDILGGEAERDGKTQSDFQKPIAQGERGALPTNISLTEYKLGGLPSALIMNSGDYEDLTVIVKSDSDGNPVEPVHHHSTSTAGGCAFCGSKNYDGSF
jgi:hypothetical protein